MEGVVGVTDEKRFWVKVVFSGGFLFGDKLGARNHQIFTNPGSTSGYHGHDQGRLSPVENTEMTKEGEKGLKVTRNAEDKSKSGREGRLRVYQEGGGSKDKTKQASETSSVDPAVASNSSQNGHPEETVHSSTRPPNKCCLCWCCCCSCSCSAFRSHQENRPKSSAADSELDCDPELTPSLEEIRSWGESFDNLMRHAAGRKVFREFLKCEYSEENILFWLACEELRKESKPETIEEKARLIYEDYISILSPKEVSLDSRVREVVNQNMVDPSPHTFDEAQVQIYTLMHRDSYPRFVNSIMYKKLAQLNVSHRGSSVSTSGLRSNPASRKESLAA